MANLSNDAAHSSDNPKLVFPSEFGSLECLKEELCSLLKMEIQSGFADLSLKLFQEIRTCKFQGSAKQDVDEDEDCASKRPLPVSPMASIPSANMDFDTAESNTRQKQPRAHIRSASTSSDIEDWRSHSLWKDLVSHDIDKHNSKIITSIQKLKKRSLQDVPDNCLVRFVLGTTFTLLSFALILLNAIWMGYESDHPVGQQNSQHRTWQDIVDLFFTLWFLVEILLKMTALRIHFFFGDDWAWNLFDLTLVLSSIPSIFVSTMNMAFLRMLRFIKLSRALRLVRLVKYVTSLREILLSLFLTLGSLFWSFVAIALTTYIFALLFMQWINLQMQAGVQYSNSLTENFKSTWDAMVTLFSFISGGQDWYDTMREFDHKFDALAKSLLTFYIFFMSFGLVNVIIGVFVARASDATADDYHLRVAKQQEHVAQSVRDLTHIFEEIDHEHTGSIDRDMFNAYFQKAHGQYILQSLGLQLNDTSHLWHVLDSQDGLKDGMLDVTGFVMGVMRLSGEAKSTELVIMAVRIQEIQAILQSILVSNEEMRVRKQTQLAPVREPTQLAPVNPYFAFSL